jgi:uncharacterized membrane protein YfcA
MIDDPFFYALAIPAVLLVAINKTAFASGLGVLAVPLMTLSVPPLQAAAIMLPVYCVMDLFAMWSYRREWDRANLRIILPAGFVGIGIGWLSAGMLSTPVIKVIIGAIAMWFTLHHWLGPRLFAARSARPAKGYACSAVAGYTSFLAHAGGPPLSMYLLPQRLTPAIYVGTTVMYWSVMNFAKLVPYASLGQLDSRNLLTALVLLPLAPVGTRLGVWLNRVVDPLWFYRIVYALTFVIGAKLVWDGLAPVLA